MKLAYVDTSCLLAIAFAETGSRPLASRLGRFDRLFSSNLLEAKLRAALLREGVRGALDVFNLRTRCKSVKLAGCGDAEPRRGKLSCSAFFSAHSAPQR